MQSAITSAPQRLPRVIAGRNKTTVVFYLGVHEPAWMPRSNVRLFVSHRRLTRRVKYPRAKTQWALDSGGFTEISLHGKWTVTPQDYVRACERYMSEIGKLEWCSPQDWMCEPHMIEKTGLTVREHQQRTLDNYLLLRSLSPKVPYIPVLQGWRAEDYVQHAHDYLTAGVDLNTALSVGVGSVCRRQGTEEAVGILKSILSVAPKAKLHFFGLKTLGVQRLAPYLASSDSMSWSLNARKGNRLPGHEKVHASCANCFDFALAWRQRLLSTLPDSALVDIRRNGAMVLRGLR